MFTTAWTILKDTVLAFIEDGALSRGASIAFYTITSLAPVLVIVVAVAGLMFGQAAAEDAIASQASGLMGRAAAEVLQNAIRSASGVSSGIIATVLGLATLVVTASGVFGEIQSSLNTIWKTRPRGTTMAQLVRARLLSLGLVLMLGFLLMLSLVISAVLTALGDTIERHLPYGKLVLWGLNALISFVLITALFAAIYKVLPDRRLLWRDVITGAVATSLLFSIGRWGISLYLGSSAVASSYGAAGALLVLLLWIYYSAQIFLLGAEFTKIYASHKGSQRAAPLLPRHDPS
jgi:membrane protein